MLWYKGWLETRFRILFMFLFAIFPIPLMTLTPHPANPAPQDFSAGMQAVAEMFALYYSIIPLGLAGSGIKTQSPFHPTKGLHGSMYFTLSMPVSRFQLFATGNTPQSGGEELAIITKTQRGKPAWEVRAGDGARPVSKNLSRD